jgi:hypothetical protein
MKLCKAPWLLLGLLPWSVALAELPYTFQAGDPIRASELNANFEYLESVAQAGTGGKLLRRQATLRTSGFNEVVTVPSSATDGWVLRSYVTGCGDPILRIDTDEPFTMDREAVLLVKAGETLSARCSITNITATSGYFMFDEQ